MLASGGKILLNNARLHLKRGKRYGLCGPNGAGKSTLMRSIANGQLEGFPPKEELRTVYVEHDIDASESNVPVAEYVYSDPILQDASHPAHKQVEEVLGSVGFTEEMQQSPVSSLSGGWKMKLALGKHAASALTPAVQCSLQHCDIARIWQVVLRYSLLLLCPDYFPVTCLML